ncbi:MAG: hypothetical protein M3R59_08385 [Verrucomicrobiota bacterium]|nr:hypothetical protein [Verrucomicrobiota bacterium]
MTKSSYLSSSDDGFGHQLQTFKIAIGASAAGLGVTAAQAGDADHSRRLNTIGG